MDNKQINFNNKDQIIYIPAYVEQGTELLNDANNILEDIASGIEKGLAKVESSGYNREIPYIEKGGEVSTAISMMGDTINIITKQLKDYSRGKNILPDDAIIIADEDTAKKYKIDKDRIYCSLAEYNEMPRVNPRWDSNYLVASVGSNMYYAEDGRYTRETFCNLSPNNLITLMREQGIDLDFWIREDGVYMYGDYVMVATDIPHMDGTQQAAEYRKGDLVETSLGTGIVVDYCEMAEKVRRGVFRGGGEYSEVDVWYDIYTAWQDGGLYQEIGYNDPTNSSGKGVKTLISEGSTRSSLYTSDTPLQTTVHTLEYTVPQTSPSTSPTVINLGNSPSPTINPSSQPTTSSTPTYVNNYQPSTTSNQPTVQTLKQETTNLNKESNLVNSNNQNVNLGMQTVSAVQTVTENQNIQVPTYSNVNNSSFTTPVVNTTPNIGSLASESAGVYTSSEQQVSNGPSNSTVNPSNNAYVVPNISSSSEPIKTSKAVSAIPILASLGLATAAGVSSKIYLDGKKNKQSTQEDLSADDNDDLNDDVDDNVVTDEWLDSGDE